MARNTNKSAAAKVDKQNSTGSPQNSQIGSTDYSEISFEHTENNEDPFDEDDVDAENDVFDDEDDEGDTVNSSIPSSADSQAATVLYTEDETLEPVPYMTYFSRTPDCVEVFNNGGRLCTYIVSESTKLTSISADLVGLVSWGAGWNDSREHEIAQIQPGETQSFVCPSNFAKITMITDEKSHYSVRLSILVAKGKKKNFNPPDFHKEVKRLTESEYSTIVTAILTPK
jgi:hypothetical protein